MATPSTSYIEVMPNLPPTHTIRPVRTQRKSASRRGYGRAWKKRRDVFLREHPLCAHCELEGLVVEATEVDHIIPRSRGGGEGDDNLQALCHMHHSQKTASEDGGFANRRK